MVVIKVTLLTSRIFISSIYVLMYCSISFMLFIMLLCILVVMCNVATDDLTYIVILLLVDYVNVVLL